MLYFDRPDTALCNGRPFNPDISVVIYGLDMDEKVDLQLTYEIVSPNKFANEKKYFILDNVGNGKYRITPQMFGEGNLWPGLLIGGAPLILRTKKNLLRLISGQIYLIRIHTIALPIPVLQLPLASLTTGILGSVQNQLQSSPQYSILLL